MPTARLEDIETPDSAAPDTEAPAPPEQEVIPKPASDKPEGQAHEWSSTQVNMPPEIAQAVLAFAQSIPPEKIISGKDEGQGEPHTTLLYGIDSTDAAPIKAALQDAEPVRLKLGKLGLFENDDADVLMIEVESPDLEALNAQLRAEVPHVDKQLEYHPHLTIAYLKPGEGAEFVNKGAPGITGKRMKLDTVKFSSKDGTVVDIPLGQSSAEPSQEPAPTPAE